ncbi:hypothetical protein SHJG_2849 [Streptomyces hygroscopicus subsp. jinggangensis 5008]|nr:hypothetical protein SHJG_2849 [Streptomyces hygroscopicus subsp. jinggangensis 5008]AGF62279.1 hypothetical protein SHJGH_2613 [Streptomyces hygroscopicus subsp. jinggangensis TL01]
MLIRGLLRTSESPAYWLAWHMTRSARGKDQQQRPPRAPHRQHAWSIAF